MPRAGRGRNGFVRNADNSIPEDRSMEPLPTLTDDVDVETEEERLVHAWRTEQLRRLGLHRIVADAFADAVDWHALAELVGRGCSPELALEIVR
jgi:hypothetical protein